MGDVVFGYVYDFGTGEEWTAERGVGAFLGGEPLGPVGPKETIEILSFEGTTTAAIAERSRGVLGLAERVRVMGSLALSLCHLAAGRVDAVCSLKAARAVDIAAAQLLVRRVRPRDRALRRSACSQRRRSISCTRSRLAAAGSPELVGSARRRASLTRWYARSRETGPRRDPEGARAGHRPRAPDAGDRARHGARRPRRGRRARLGDDRAHRRRLPAAALVPGAGVASTSARSPGVTARSARLRRDDARRRRRRSSRACAAAGPRRRSRSSPAHARRRGRVGQGRRRQVDADREPRRTRSPRSASRSGCSTGTSTATRSRTCSACTSGRSWSTR